MGSRGASRHTKDIKEVGSSSKYVVLSAPHPKIQQSRVWLATLSQVVIG